MPYHKLERAIQFALDAHRGRYRSGPKSLPYILHPLDVLHKARHLGGITEEDALCAAVLHDVLEDTEITADQMEAEFGQRTTFLVLQLTRGGGTLSKEDYSQMLMGEIRKMDPAAQIIKMADRLSNLWESARTRPPDRTRTYALEARQMLEIIPRERAPELWEALSRSIDAATR
jgi:guanosine-3',5'-bis(diphosphate) 3'-pyrophosphohydrolase